MALTKSDFNQLLKNFVTKAEFNSRLDELEEKIKFLPTKDEFYVSMDKLMKELEITRFADLEERV